MSVELVVAADPAEEVGRRIAAAARAGGPIALSGGGTPRPAYELAAQLEPSWGRVDLWLVDERCVPGDDERSNWRLLAETILEGAAEPPRAHRVETELPPEDAAARYDADLRGVRLVLAVMGIGADGHTASLFPNAPQLDERERAAVAAEAGLEPYVPRVTMTIPALAAAETMLYLVVGEDKAEAVARAFVGPPTPAVPASLVRGRRTIAVLDEAAAAGLT